MLYYLFSKKYEKPDYSIFKKFNQKSIFEKQSEEYIKKENKLIVLSGIPLFIIDYFGENLYKKLK